MEISGGSGMKHTIDIIHEGRTITLEAEHGSNLLEVLLAGNIEVDSPCGGNGKCGKCRVRIEAPEAAAIDEIRILGKKDVDRGYRLACRTTVKNDMRIYPDNINHDARIVTKGKGRQINFAPSISKKHVVLDKPDLSRQEDDLTRLENTGLGKVKDLELLKKLPHILREADFDITVATFGEEIISVEKGDTSGKSYGIAVDIGTTTIAAYLYDLTTGNQMDVYSVLNAQRKYGADVLSRIDYCSKSRETRDEMHKTIISQINDIVRVFTKRNGIDPVNIYELAFAGNTTMIHFLLNLPTFNIAVAPFIPASTALFKVKAGHLGIKVNDGAYVVVLPCVSAYIGADTVAAVLSSNMYMDDGCFLLIDIGTNGEIVLGGREWLYACSTAAGPAFEGANIRNGTGGISGAIDKVYYDNGLKYTTIGKANPIGICGSGIVDSIAVMLEHKAIDETGRIAGPDEMENMPDHLRERIINIDGMRAFVIEHESSASGGVIAITQKDIREVQNAKAAIAAGIKVLAQKAGIGFGDIKKVYLAGGFGSHIDVDSAVNIGLIPFELRDRTESIGNAAGQGVIEGLTCSEILEHAERVKTKIQYIELSADPGFSDYYVDSMFFDVETKY